MSVCPSPPRPVAIPMTSMTPEPAREPRVAAPPRPAFEIREGAYVVRLARSELEIDRALQLRYRVFNLELDEGLASSHALGRDEDVYDAQCDHLVAIHEPSGEIVGTYRLQTRERAETAHGFYSDDEFRLGQLPPDVLRDGVELGRACIHADHRRQRLLFALWKGLAAYVVTHGKHFLFGCCSITSQDVGEGLAVMEWLRREGHVAPEPLANVMPGFECEGPAPSEEAVAAVSIPKLFGTYLRYNGRVHSRPAIDRSFGTIDYLVVVDIRELDARARAMFLDGLLG